MANTLDRLDAEHGGDARSYVAQLFVVGGATREQVAQKLRERYGVEVTTRIITTWRNGDKKLIALMEELEAVKRELQPDDDLGDVLSKMPRPVDPAQSASDLFGMAIRFPAFAKLMSRDGQRAEENNPAAELGFGFAPSASAGAEDDLDNDVRAVLAAGHETDEEFEADCLRRLSDYQPSPH